MQSCLHLHPQPQPQASIKNNSNKNSQTNSKTLVHLLKQSKTQSQTKQIHAQIICHGLSLDPTLFSSLIRLYSSHRRLDLASSLLSRFPNPPAFAWNLMIRAHALANSPTRALLLYTRMLRSNLQPDKFTLTFVVTALSSMLLVDRRKYNLGRAVHGSAVKAGMVRCGLHFKNSLMHFYFASGDVESGRKVFDGMRVRSVVSWTALVSGLVDCGEVDGARKVFDEMPVRNVVAWTAMIGGYARSGRPDAALELFWCMLEDNIMPNEFTLVALLIACAELGSLSMGRWVHEFAEKNELNSGVYVGTALIDMYSKCGSLEAAVEVFNQMPVRSLATWNSMITSLGVHGYGKHALLLFREMEAQNMKLDEVTLVGVLSACAREEMVEEGWRLFTHVREKYGIEVVIGHYRCLVELLDCEGVKTVKKLVKELNDNEQRLLLKACREHGKLELEDAISSCTRESDNFNYSVQREVELLNGK